MSSICLFHPRGFILLLSINAAKRNCYFCSHCVTMSLETVSFIELEGVLCSISLSKPLSEFVGMGVSFL